MPPSTVRFRIDRPCAMSRAAPAASWPVAPNGAWRLLHGVALGAAAASVAWVIAQALEFQPGQTGALCAGLALLGAGWGARLGRQSSGSLQWTGSQWLWCALGAPAAELQTPAVMIDLSAWLLLRCARVEGRRLFWLVLSANANGAPAGNPGPGFSPPSLRATDLSWAAFRAALYSRDSSSYG